MLSYVMGTENAWINQAISLASGHGWAIHEEQEQTEMKK